MERKTKLSKGILELKFMKKSKEKFEKEAEEEEREQLYGDQLSTLHTGAHYVSMVPSHYDCHEYLPCRLSFGGFDPETEKINATKLKGLYAPIRPTRTAVRKEDDMEVDVPADELHERMGTSLDDHTPKSFVHKNSKAHRFEPKRRSNDQFGGDTRGKFSKRGRGGVRQRNSQSDHMNGHTQNHSADYEDNKRKFDGESESTPQRKFLKPA
ncbi:M-phase phosphoprotein 6 [Trinorchestia longiramus]|nr:M-phase phosphoprotein 6 [Trinorchestia longiramus]